MFKFAHRIMASTVTAKDINAVAAQLVKALDIRFGPLKPGKTKCLASDSDLSPWGKKKLAPALKELGFEKSGKNWHKDGLEILVNADHVIIQERGPK